MAEGGRIIGEFIDYDEMLAAVRARVNELSISSGKVSEMDNFLNLIRALELA